MFASSFPLIALNTAAALLILARYFYRGLNDPDQKKWLQALAVPGGVAIVVGSPLLRGLLLGGILPSYLDALSVLLGFLLVGLAVALWRGWNLMPLGIYALLAGLVMLILGLRSFSSESVSLALAQILAGLGCFLVPDILRSRRNQIAGAALFTASAIFWLFAGLGAVIEALNHIPSLTFHLPPLG